MVSTRAASLLKRLPASLKTPDQYERYKSSDLVFTGSGTFFPGKKGAKKTDAPAGAALVVLAGGEKAVYWSKPADLSYDDEQPVPDLFGKFGFGNVWVIQADGKTRSFRQGEVDEKALRALITGK